MKRRQPLSGVKPKAYERPYEGSGNTFTWSERESLVELKQPERMEAIKRDYELRTARKRERREGLALAQVFGDEIVEEDKSGCLICSL